MARGLKGVNLIQEKTRHITDSEKAYRSQREAITRKTTQENH